MCQIFRERERDYVERERVKKANFAQQQQRETDRQRRREQIFGAFFRIIFFVFFAFVVSCFFSSKKNVKNLPSLAISNTLNATTTLKKKTEKSVSFVAMKNNGAKYREEETLSPQRARSLSL